MNCQSCGTMNAPGATFCAKCGTNMMGAGMGAGGMPMVPRTSGMAIAGFILSFFCGLLGLIISWMGYSEVKKSNGALTGEGLALAGIIISIVSMVIGFMIAAGRH